MEGTVVDPLGVGVSHVEAVFHEVSVYPKKELPFFILFTAGLCSFTAMLALLTHQFPELMGVFAKAFLSTLFAPLNFIMEKVESILPSSLWHQLTRIWLRKWIELTELCAKILKSSHTHRLREKYLCVETREERHTNWNRFGLHLNFLFLFCLFFCVGGCSISCEIVFFVFCCCTQKKKEIAIIKKSTKIQKIKDFLWIDATKHLLAISYCHSYQRGLKRRSSSICLLLSLEVYMVVHPALKVTGMD